MIHNFLSVLLRGWLGLVEARVREYISGSTNDVLSDIPDILGCEPSSHIDICEFKPSAGVSRIASDYTRWEDTAMYVNIAYSYVSHGDSRVDIAVLVKRVQHAAWAAAIWLFLLLSADVNPPPEGVLYFQTII